jgi:hypothetical protein
MLLLGMILGALVCVVVLFFIGIYQLGQVKGQQAKKRSKR